MRTFGLILAATVVAAVNAAGIKVSPSLPLFFSSHPLFVKFLERVRLAQSQATPYFLLFSNYSLRLTTVYLLRASLLQHDSDGNIVVSPSKGTTIFM